mmetsp:Transcript_3705/g.6781  ORF Transcript_3705/g.6781 Transcript_3705/m.6781 type:complete len:203 (+) Transcript_3705:1449-2057(+)
MRFFQRDRWWQQHIHCAKDQHSSDRTSLSYFQCFHDLNRNHCCCCWQDSNCHRKYLRRTWTTGMLSAHAKRFGRTVFLFLRIMEGNDRKSVVQDDLNTTRRKNSRGRTFWFGWNRSSGQIKTEASPPLVGRFRSKPFQVSLKPSPSVSSRCFSTYSEKLNPSFKSVETELSWKHMRSIIPGKRSFVTRPLSLEKSVGHWQWP